MRKVFYKIKINQHFSNSFVCINKLNYELNQKNLLTIPLEASAESLLIGPLSYS